MTLSSSRQHRFGSTIHRPSLVHALSIWLPLRSPSVANSRLGERGEIVPSRSHLDRHLSSFFLYTFVPRSSLSSFARILFRSRLGRVVAPVPSLFFRVFSRTWRGLPSRVTCYPDTMGSRTQTCKMARPTVATQTPSSLAAAVETGLHARLDVSRIAVIRCCGYRAHAADSTTRVTCTRCGERFVSV